eukprot:UN10930
MLCFFLKNKQTTKTPQHPQRQSNIYNNNYFLLFITHNTAFLLI